MRLSVTSTIFPAWGYHSSTNSLLWCASPPSSGAVSPPPTACPQAAHKQEQVRHSTPLILVISSLGLAWLHQQGSTGTAQLLLGRVVHTHERTAQAMRPSVHIQHILHPIHELATLLRRDTPLLPQVRVEFALSYPAYWLVRHLVHYLKLHQPVGQQTQAPACRPFRVARCMLVRSIGSMPSSKPVVDGPYRST